MLADAMGFAFDVERFERIDASADTALLRLSGRWRADAEVSLGVPVLLVDDGRRAHPVKPLPDPSGGAASTSPAGSEWRAAFPVPQALLTARSAFALRAGAAGVVEIPRPGARDAAPLPPPAPAPPKP